MSISHLAKRFLGSVSAKRLNDAETAWVHTQLLPTEIELWNRMGTADQRHAYGVAQTAERLLGDKATRPALAAALLHDIGKVDAPTGTMTRVLATIVGGTAQRAQIESWAEEDGWLGKVGKYLNHNNIGAEMLTAAGSDPLTIAWAREHEIPASEWTLPEEISDALYKADNQ